MSSQRKRPELGLLPEDLLVERVRFADVKTELHVDGNAEQPDDQVLVLAGGTHLPGSIGWLRDCSTRWSRGTEPNPATR